MLALCDCSAASATSCGAQDPSLKLLLQSIWVALTTPDKRLCTFDTGATCLGQQYSPRQRRQGRTLLSCIIPLVICIQRSNLLRHGYDELHHCDGVSSGSWSFSCNSINLKAIVIPRYSCCWGCDVLQKGSHVCVCCLSSCFEMWLGATAGHCWCLFVQPPCLCRPSFCVLSQQDTCSRSSAQRWHSGAGGLTRWPGLLENLNLREGRLDASILF